MPLQSVQKINPDTYVGFWEINESITNLTNQLSDLAPATLVIPAFTSMVRQQQWLAARLLVYTLLQNFTSEAFLLSADLMGKPYLENCGVRLSISHTPTTVAVILSEHYEVGIDIETIHPKVLRVKEKFMNTAELAHAGDNLLKTMLYWCTKETLYKVYGQKKVSFKEHLGIRPFVLQNTGTLDAYIHSPVLKKDYLVYYETKKDYLLTYCLDKPGA